jgi:hypothetical protein
MTTIMALLGSALLSSMPLAPAGLIVNNCDNAKQWRGASCETLLVKEGAGAAGWVPSKSVELSTRAIDHDWSGGNCLRFWMHSAKASGSRLALVLPSENPGREGSNYFCLELCADWQGWREIIAPLKEIGAVRHPVGWHKIDCFRLHAAWNPANKINPDDAFMIDDIRVVRLSKAGAVMSDKEFFEALDLDYFLARRRSARWRPTPPSAQSRSTVKARSTAASRSREPW